MIAIGDIESFFNENFFKKVPVQEREIDHRKGPASDVTRFNGSPETHYEPFYNTYIPYNSTKPKEPKEEVQPSKPTFSNRPNHFNRDISDSKPIFPKPYDFDLGEKKSVPYKSSQFERENDFSSTKPNFQRQYDFRIGDEKPIRAKAPKQENKFSLDKEMKDFEMSNLNGMPKFPEKNVFDEHSAQVKN